MQMRVIYMGTPDFAVHALVSIVEAGHDVVACFTQPDKAKGRSKKLQPAPVKVQAMEYDIPVYQPVKLREQENVDIIRAYAPDVIVVAAYGQILPESILNIPKYGCVNIHASLLPKYRGAAPIEWAIIDGEKETGVTTMYMAKGLDTGDMILRDELDIPEDMTGSELHDRLSEMGGRLIGRTLEGVQNGTAPRIPQEGDTCYASMISKEELLLDFTKPAVQVRDFIRAMSAVPCAYTLLDGKRMKVYGARVSDRNYSGAPGEIVDTDAFAVMCGDGAVEFTEIQPEGGKRMDIQAYLRGKKPEKGTILGK